MKCPPCRRSRRSSCRRLTRRQPSPPRAASSTAAMKTLTTHVQRVAGDERGAVLVQVAIAMLVMTAMATFVVDHGVLWVSRGQAQNAADAGALSGAIARAYDDLAPTSNGMTSSSALGAALANNVWNAAPTAQVSLACPSGVAGSCVRVD